MHIERGEHVVQEQNLRMRVHRARKGNARLLAARERQTLLADLGHVPRVEQRQVALERALVDDCH